MADLLTHVLVPFVLLTPVSWFVPAIDRRWIVVGMAGAAIPDLVKISIVLPDTVVESILGLPFSYAPISSLAGLLVIGGAIAVLFENRARRAFGYIVFGGVTSLLLDGMRVFADGQAGFYLYPIWWRPPTPSLYVTSDPRVTAVAVVVAAVVCFVDRQRRDSTA